MPIWSNDPAVVFHGTDTAALGQVPATSTTIQDFKVSLAKCKPSSDFGRGFYVTTNELQAREWANARVRHSRTAGASAADAKAVVLSFKIGLSELARLETLCFVRPTNAYHTFVDSCRRLQQPHRRQGPRPAYDVVFGPVRMWPQRLIIQDADQWGFHTEEAIAILPEATVHGVSRRTSGLL